MDYSLFGGEKENVIKSRYNQCVIVLIVFQVVHIDGNFLVSYIPSFLHAKRIKMSKRNLGKDNHILISDQGNQ